MTKLVLSPRGILSCKQDAPHLRRHDQSNHLATSIAVALNCPGSAMVRGRGGGGVFNYSTDGLLNAGPTTSTYGPVLF